MNNVVQLKVEEKVCSKCGVSKALSEYQQHTGFFHDAASKVCKECSYIQRDATWAAKKAEKEQNYIPPLMRICNTCSLEKIITSFAKSKNHKDGRRPECSDCRAIKHAEWRAKQNATPEERQEYLAKKKAYSKSIGYYDNYFMKRFGITYADVKAMYDAQFGRCANRACGKEIVFYHDNEHGRAHPSRACVDHNHETGAVRALLCMACNTILGTLETKENIILGLMEYRQKHNQQLKE